MHRLFPNEASEWYEAATFPGVILSEHPAGRKEGGDRGWEPFRHSSFIERIERADGSDTFAMEQKWNWQMEADRRERGAAHEI